MLVRGRRNVQGYTFLDLPYVAGGVTSQRLDLYYPTSGSLTLPLPCMIALHGGGWQSGDKALPGTGHAFAELKSNGIVIASINYRLSGEAVWPAPIYDAKAAVRWVRANAIRLGIDPYRIGIWGVSSGGHLAALVGTTGTGRLTDTSLGNPNASEWVKVCVAWQTPTRFDEEDADWASQVTQNGRGFAVCSTSSQEAELFGGVGAGVNPCSGGGLTKTIEAAPETYIAAANSTQFLIEHGDADPTVPYKQGENFHDALTAAGISSTWRLAVGKGHTGNDWNNDATLRAATASWIVARL